MNSVVSHRIDFEKQNKTRELDLSGCNLVAIPKEVSELTWLETISCFWNPSLVDISALIGLTRLNRVDLYKTGISDIAPLSPLINIESLDLSDTNVSDLTPILKLIKKGVPVYVGNNSGNQGIILNNCPAAPPPEYVMQGQDAIKRWLIEKEKTGTIKLKEAKILIVGQGASGKTSLKRKLLSPLSDLPSQDEITEGIEFNTLDCIDNQGENFRLNLWDFGGQVIQRFAHQFFLTGSSLYVLLSNDREQNPNFQYWLHIIEMLGGNSPVLIVQNEKTGQPGGRIENEEALIEKFPQVTKPFYSVNLLKAGNADKNRFNKVKDAIVFHASQLPHLTKEYPSSFFKVRERLEELAPPEKNTLGNYKWQGRNYISWKEYEAICESEGIVDEATIKDIVTAFTYTGMYLWFDELVLKDYVFLRPKWVIDAQYLLILSQKIDNKQGILDETDVQQVWEGAEYEGMHSLLIRLLERFYLCYRMIGFRNRYIIPQLLPAAKPENGGYGWDSTSVIKAKYQYRFKPDGIVTRLTCRLHEMIDKNVETGVDRVWNDAVILSKNNEKCFVREVFASNEIEIEVWSKDTPKLLDRVFDEIDNIHSESRFTGLKFDKLIQCSCESCYRDVSPHFHEYDYLLRLLENGEGEERCKKSVKMVKILDILSQTGKSSYNKGEKKPLQAFFSYSKNDFSFLEEFKKHLKPLCDKNKLAPWDDSEILPGDKWDEKIKDKLHSAQVIFFLVSSDFWATDYIRDIEVLIAMAKQTRNECIVIPIKLRECVFEEMSFAHLQALPRKDEFIATSTARDATWTKVVREISKMIDKFQVKQ